MPHAELDRAAEVIRLQTAWQHKQLVRQIPGSRWDATGKCWTLPLSWASLVTARGVFRDDLTVGDELTAWSWNYYRERVAPALELRQALHPIDDDSKELAVIKSWGGDARPSLYDFQVAGTQFMLRAASGLLGDEMGSGSTR